jgi:3D (Asp-Asp-Asp) domain-containing protein
MNARIAKFNSIVRLTAVASLLTFVGAAKPAKKVARVAKPAVAVSVVKVAAVKVAAPVELLHDAVPASAVIAPSVVEHKLRVIRMEVTAYCPCKKCCGENAQGLTASGHEISYNQSRFVAADTDLLPFGTKLMIPGYGTTAVEVIDRGGAIKGNKLDVFFPTHEEALQWGRQWVDVTVVE